jgi:hypothetical protein
MKEAFSRKTLPSVKRQIAVHDQTKKLVIWPLRNTKMSFKLIKKADLEASELNWGANKEQILGS